MHSTEKAVIPVVGRKITNGNAELRERFQSPDKSITAVTTITDNIKQVKTE